MPNAVCPPRRMRYSLESRCKIIHLILSGATPHAAARACGASRATGYRLWARYRAEGWAGLVDRPSIPKRQPRRLPAEVEAEIVAVRQWLRAGPVMLAAVLERPASTIAGASRQRGQAACAAFLRRAERWYREQGIIDRTRALRQRQALPLLRLVRRLRRTRDRTPVHTTVFALDERQGQGGDQDAPARVDVPLRLSDERAPRPRPPRLRQVVQPPTTARLTRRPAAHQSRLKRLWSVQLAHASMRWVMPARSTIPAVLTLAETTARRMLSILAAWR